MAEILEIPELNNANLMELTVCGRLRTRNARIKEKLRKLKDGIFARVGSKKSNQYIDVFGSTLETNHLHVDVMIRPTKWARGKEFHALDNVISAIMEFAGEPIDVKIIGEFIVEVSDLPKNGIIRSALSGAKHAGLAARQTAQTLSINDSAIKELKWFETSVKNLIVVGLSVERLARIDSEYLRECENLVVRAFNALVIGGKTNAARTH